MNTRKRTASEANSSTNTAKERKSLCSAAKPLSLRKNGYMQELLPNTTAETLTIAVKAFQAQLEAWSKQPTPNRHAGFKQLAKRQRLEFRVGDDTLGQLGLLQSVAITVPDVHSMSPQGKLQPSSPHMTADCAGGASLG